MIVLSDRLSSKTYATDKTSKFKVFYPKERDIESNSFKDKVVQHSLCDTVLYDAIQPSFLYDNYASQIGKGREFGLRRLKKHLQHYFFSGKAKNERKLDLQDLPRIKVADGWVLKCDIQKYFANIRHDLVLEKLKKYISDDDVIELLQVILNAVDDSALLAIRQANCFLYCCLMILIT